MNHTRGPWVFYKSTLRPEFPRVIREVHGPDGVPVIPWGGFDQAEQSGSEKDANGKLIAAAPSLLASCKQALGYWQQFSDRLPAGHVCEDILKAAIAKAEGAA